MGYELSAYPAPHFWLSVFWVQGIQEIYFLFFYAFRFILYIYNFVSICIYFFDVFNLTVQK